MPSTGHAAVPQGAAFLIRHATLPAALVKGDEIAAHFIDLPHVGCSAGIARAYALQVIVEMRKVDER